MISAFGLTFEWINLGARASCPHAGEPPAVKALNDLGRMKDADGMEVEEDAGRMPALPGHNRPGLK